MLEVEDDFQWQINIRKRMRSLNNLKDQSKEEQRKSRKRLGFTDLDEDIDI